MDKFKTFLDQAVERFADEEREKERVRLFEQGADELIDELGIDTSFGYDTATRYRRTEKFVNKRVSEMIELGVESPMDEARFVAAEQGVRDVGKLSRMSVVCLAYTHNGDDEAATKHKKEQMAAMYVTEGIQFDDPWMEFVRRYVPGESLDPTSVNDLPVLANA